jgi:surface antigen/multidrug transporter EmrE-like cation transporter
MYQQPGSFLYKLRFPIAGTLTITFLVLVSALVTAIGSGTALDTRTASPRSMSDASASDMNVYSPNLVATDASKLADGAQRLMLSTGSALYSICRSVTTMTTQSQAVAHAGTAVVHGVWSGVALVAHGVASGTVFMFRLPGKMVSSVTHIHPVSALIRPADSKPVPVINGETSAEVLANLSAQQRQTVSRLQATQLAANKQLDGSIVAGDPNHGGYPAKWDGIRQDGAIDSWGMYSRECVSYTAWKVYQTFGDMPYWGGRGNASQWVRDARNSGIPTGSTPQVHSVAISMTGYYGHAMWVEKVQGDMIYVSQYNYDLHGHYSEMWVSSSHLTYIYFK